jgi:PKD repeat protein
MKKNPTSQSGLLHLRVLSALALCCIGIMLGALSFAATSSSTSTTGTPRYQNYVAPPGFGTDFGEPSIGVNWNSEQSFSNSLGAIPNGGTEMSYGGFTQALRTVFNDCSSPAKTIWTDVTPILPSSPRLLGDPILFSDHQTGRTFVCQLEGLTPFSTTEFTDNDGATYQLSQGSGIASGFDHETIGGGPLAPGLQTINNYKNGVYYCSQAVADANCALSLDGGQTFGPAVPIYSRATCGGLHGHIKVAPDGTAYVPNKGCGGTPLQRAAQGVALSQDNGLTWTVRLVQGTGADGSTFTSNPGDTDPSIGVATDGTVYFGYQNDEFDSTGKLIRTTAHIAVSHDKGQTWVNDTDVGASLGIQNIVFPAVAAGDPNRAAFAFFGTTTGGNYQNTTNFSTNPPTGFQGTWYLVIATTLDGGKTWTTVNATPNDPIQRGSICTGGTTCGNDRNLLDFFDANVDKEGRLVVGYDDGCISSLCINGGANDYTAKATIARQSGGPRLFAAFDPVEPQSPAAPRLEHIYRNSSGVELVWSEPDNGGSPITTYNIYRGTASGGETFLASVSNTSYYDPTLESSTVTYADVTADPNTTYYYKVSAVNASGEGPKCGELNTIGAPAPPATPVALCGNGAPVVTDPSGDATNPLGINDSSLDQVDILGASFSSDAVAKTLTTTLTLKNITSPPLPITGTTDTSYWVVWTGTGTDSTGNVVDKIYATRAMEPDLTSGALSFRYGEYDPANNAFITSTATTGSITPGPNGTISVNVPLSAINNPTIPVAPSATPAVRRPYALTVSGYGLPGSPGLRFVASDDRAPNIGFGADWSVCPAVVPINDTPPTAVLKASPLSGNFPLTVNFDGSGSSDIDGDKIASYTFNFGDGSAPVTQPGPTTSHTYSSCGNYVATLTVTDSRGTISINNASKFITVTGPDLVASKLSASSNQVKQGQKITLTATITNQGTAGAGSSYTGFVLDGKTSIGQVSTPSINAGSSTAVTLKWNTSKVSKGTYTITATADAKKQVPECDESNNTSAPITVTVQ